MENYKSQVPEISIEIPMPKCKPPRNKMTWEKLDDLLYKKTQTTDYSLKLMIPILKKHLVFKDDLKELIKKDNL